MRDLFDGKNKMERFRRFVRSREFLKTSDVVKWGL